MKSERFVHSGVWINNNRDCNGRYYTAWKPNVSRIFKNTDEMLKWLQWPAKTPTGDAIREWIQELKQRDAELDERQQ